MSRLSTSRPFITGNGSSNSRFDFGNAVICLTPALQETAYFAPSNFAAMSSADLDLTSSPGPAPGEPVRRRGADADSVTRAVTVRDLVVGAQEPTVAEEAVLAE